MIWCGLTAHPNCFWVPEFFKPYKSLQTERKGTALRPSFVCAKLEPAGRRTDTERGRQMNRRIRTWFCMAVAALITAAFPRTEAVAAETGQAPEVLAETSAVTILPQLAAAAAGPMQAEGTELKVYVAVAVAEGSAGLDRSEERRVGKEC